jgi:hypothetical protein
MTINKVSPRQHILQFFQSQVSAALTRRIADRLELAKRRFQDAQISMIHFALLECPIFCADG